MDGIGIRLDEKTDSMGTGEVTQGKIIDHTLHLGFMGFEYVTNPYLYFQIHPKIVHDFLSQRIRWKNTLDSIILKFCYLLSVIDLYI